jgi:hypothetical protein
MDRGERDTSDSLWQNFPAIVIVSRKALAAGVGLACFQADTGHQAGVGLTPTRIASEVEVRLKITGKTPAASVLRLMTVTESPTPR